MELNLSHESAYIFKSSNPILGFAADEEEAVWIPYEPGTANRFLMFDLSNNSFAVVLRCAPGSGIDRHYHTGSVAGYCLRGFLEVQGARLDRTAGTFVYERPGEADTLQIVGNETMMSFFTSWARTLHSILKERKSAMSMLSVCLSTAAATTPRMV